MRIAYILGILFCLCGFPVANADLPFKPQFLPIGNASASKHSTPSVLDAGDDLYQEFEIPVGWRYTKWPIGLGGWASGGTGVDYFTGTTYTVTADPGFTIRSVVCDDSSIYGVNPTGCVVYFDYPAVKVGEENLYLVLDTIFVVVDPTSGTHTPFPIHAKYHLRIKSLPFEPQNPVCTPGSIIHTENQTVAESIPIVGTPFDLFYSTSLFATAVATNLPSQNYFPMNGLTISAHHLFDPVQGKIFYGTGKTTSARSTTLSSGNIMVVDSDGSYVYIFDSTGKHLETKTFLTGATVYSFAYDLNGRLATITDAFSNVTTINRDGNGDLSSIVGPYGQTTSFALTGTHGLISTVTNPNGEVHSFTYKTGTSLMETFTKPGGQASTFTYDGSGRLTQDLSAGGDFWNFLWNSAPAVDGTLTGYTLARQSKTGLQTIYTPSISGSNYSLSYTTPFGSVPAHAEGTAQYDSDGVGNVGHNLGDDERFGAAYERQLDETIRMGGVDRVTILGQSVSWPAGVTDPFGFTSITNTSTINSQTTTSTYTASTKTRVATTPQGVTSSTTLNSNEQVVSKQYGSDTAWNFSYDGHGRLLTVAQGTANSLTYSYGTSGFLSSITDGLSHTTSYGYDLAGRVTSVTLPDSRVVYYSYDSNGNVTSVTPPSTPAHNFTYNAFQALDTYSPPSVTGLATKNTTYSYNDDKEITQISRPDGATVGFTYGTSSGLLTAITMGTTSFSFSYKTNSDQYDTVASPDDLSDTFSWYGRQVASDAQKQASTASLWGKVTWAYDSLHRPSSRTLQGHSSGTTYTRNYTYDNDSRPTQIGDESITYGSGSDRVATTTLGKISDSRTYDAYGNLSGYTAIYTPTGSSPTTLYSYTLTRDAMSRIVSKSETVLGTTNTFAYSYDSAGRLTQVLKNSAAYSSYTYDDNSNRTSGSTAGTSFSATYDAQDRILTYGTASYTHNSNGDITQIDWGTASSSTFTYDALGHLKASTTSNGSNLVYAYDGMGRRANKTSSGTFQWHYLYEGGERIAGSTNSSGTIQKEYVYGVEHDNVPDYLVSNGSTNFRIIKDYMGSPKLIINASTGTAAQQMDYNDLGFAATDTNPGFQPFGFAGGIYDQNTKLVKFGAREYDPKQGRWMTKDPIGFAGGDTNLYGYVLGDPINSIDPSGNDGEALGGLAAALAAASAQIEAAAATAAAYAGAVVGAVGYGVLGAVALAPTATAPPDVDMAPVQMSKGGKQNISDTGLADLTDEEVRQKARDKSLSGKERLRHVKEEKQRRLRNKRKRGGC